ncbi:gamma-glutamylcyclotransferase family protein [Streptomyces sp. NPDC007861]|uniref:gamma-glutamylcyclotransferase family protein n=1 Tax=Streptomyces sp. NPDC007861 TaxID=3154893 RepID=UPI0033F3B967
MRQELPFFVYGTLRPGGHNHDLFLRGRTCAEEPARLPGALLYEGPGYPYAVDGDGIVTGELVTAAPGHYRELTAVLDHLEEYVAPADPRNLYERVVRTVRTERGAVVAWVYLAAEHTAAELRVRGTPVPGGDWSTASG